MIIATAVCTYILVFVATAARTPQAIRLRLTGIPDSLEAACARGHT
jgi:hypothetical protein